MIELTAGQISTMPLMNALGKLSQMPHFNGQVAYRISKIHQALLKFHTEVFQKFNQIGRELGSKSEDGKPLIDPKGFHIPLPGKEEEYKIAIETLMAEKVQIHQLKIHIAALKSDMAPSEMLALEPILEGLDEEPNPA